MILPDSRRKIYWDAFIFVITILTAIFTPLNIIFGTHLSAYWVWFEIVSGLFFAIDIAIRFNTAVVVDGRLVLDKKLIAKKYLRRSFWIDLFAVMPWSMVAFAVSGPILFYSSGLPHLDSFHTFELLSLFRLVRIFEFTKRLERGAYANASMIRLGVLLFWLSLSAHWIACAWYYLQGDGTADLKGDNYLRAMYWCVTTICTIGYGDITPKTNGQILFTIFIEIFGAGFYGFLIGNLASLLANMDLIKTRFRERLERMTAFLSYHRIPTDLRTNVHEYYTHLWEVRRGQDDSSILNDLPVTLRGDVIYFLSQPILEKVPFLKDASEPLLRELSLNVTARLALPEETIFSKGDRGEELYLINRGSVEVLNQKGDVLARLGEGNFFGEVALLEDSPRNATIKSSEYTDLYILKKDTFDHVLKKYPDFAKNVRAIAAQRKNK
jgi:voltage-gated potassium channel